MDTCFNLPENCRVGYVIPADKIYHDPLWQEGQEPYIIWDYKLSPKATNILHDPRDSDSFQEIHFITLQLHENEDIADLYRYSVALFRAVKYAVVLTVKYRNKQKVLCCTYRRGALDSDKNILVGLRMTAWIYPEDPSSRAKNFYTNVNALLKEKKPVSELYQEICNEVDLFRAVYINKSKTTLLMKDLLGRNLSSAFTGKATDPFRFCTSFRFRPVLEQEGKYVVARSKRYYVEFDCEDLWFAFRQDERFWRVIQGRRYSNIEELVYYIENKYEQ